MGALVQAALALALCGMAAACGAGSQAPPAMAPPTPSMSTGLPPGHLAVSNGGTKGTWGPPEFCSAGHHAKGFSIKVEKGQKPTKDHVALTGVGLLCTDSNLVTSAQGSWGVWSHSIVCPAGLLTRFRLRVQAPQGDFDDTAANSAEFACADGSRLRLPAGTRGRWGDWSPRCSPGTAVCGLQTRVQPPQGNGDDTALNDLRLLCCS